MANPQPDELTQFMDKKISNQIFNPHGMFIGSFIPNALLKYGGISPGAKLVWARLAQYAGKNGIAFPKQETLAMELGINKRQVRRYLEEIEKKGLIKRVLPLGKERLNHAVTRYYFIWHDLFNDQNGTSGGDNLSSPGKPANPCSSKAKKGQKCPEENHYKENHNKHIRVYETNFEIFWAEYPRKIEKQRAYKSWKARTKEGASGKELIEAAKNYSNDCRKQHTEERYIKHASTFLGPDKPYLDWITKQEKEECKKSKKELIKSLYLS